MWLRSTILAGPPISAIISDIMSFMQKQRMAIFIWATILVVAAQFFASSAFAHGGHSHDHGSANHRPTMGYFAPEHVQQNINPSESIYAVQPPSADVMILTTGGMSAPLAADAASNGCGTGCCGAGIGCCGGACLADAMNALPDFRPTRETISALFEYGSSINPEALKRPPRTLA